MEVSLHNMKKVAGKPGAKSMWFCMLCLSDLTGQNIELHFRSPEHVKKVVTSATSKLESGNSPFYCELCLVGCNTQHVYDQHISGKKHKKFQNAAARIKSLPTSPDDAVEELRAMLKETVLEEGKASALGVSEDMKEFYTLQEPLIGLQYAVEIRGLTCDSPIYHCTLCNVHVISGNKGKHFCSNNHRQLVLQKDYPDKWVKIKSSSSVKTELHQLVSEMAKEIETAEGKKVQEILRRIVQKPSWNEPVDKSDKKANRGFRGKGRKRGGGGGRGGGGNRQSGESGASGGGRGGAVTQRGKRGGQGQGGNHGRGRNQGRGRGGMHPPGHQRGGEGPSRGGPSPRGAFWRRRGGKERATWLEQDEGAFQYGEQWHDVGYPRVGYHGYQEDYYQDPYGGDGWQYQYQASLPAWDRPLLPPPSRYSQTRHPPPPLHMAPYQDSAMDPSPTHNSLRKLLQSSGQSSEIDNLTSSLVRTPEDADMALKLSSALNQALVRYHAAPPSNFPPH